MILNEFFNLPQVFEKSTTAGYNSEYNDEAGMARTNLHTIARAAKGLLDTIDDKENLPEWVQEKIAKVEGMMVSAWDYLESQEEQGVAEGQEVDVSVVVGKLYDAIDHAENEIKNADYDRQVQYATTVKNRALEALNMIKLNPQDVNAAWKYFQNGQQGVAEGAEFGSNYAEQLAQQTFDIKPDLKDENEVLTLGYGIAKREMGSRAHGIFRSEDFPSDFVSAYGWLQDQKQGMAEGEQQKGADYRDPPEADYGDDYQAMVQRVGQKARAQEKAKQQPKAPVKESRKELMRKIIQS